MQGKDVGIDPQSSSGNVMDKVQQSISFSLGSFPRLVPRHNSHLDSAVAKSPVLFTPHNDAECRKGKEC